MDASAQTVTGPGSGASAAEAKPTMSLPVPRVSILMPVRDGEAYLGEAIESLLAQDLPDFQFVIVDDGSGPAARALLDRYAAADSRILLLRNPTSRGIPASLNLGLARCTAPLTARADGDDIYLPQRLSRQVAFLDANPEIGVVSCDWYRVSGGVWSEPRSRLVSDPDQIAFRRLFMNQLLHPGVMFRTGIIKAAGGYDLRYWTAQDSELWARIADRTRFSNMPDRLLGYRVHDKSMMRSRGGDGLLLSLSVPVSQLRAYLGDDRADSELAAAVRLFRGEGPSAIDELDRAAQLLACVHTRALLRERAHVVIDFERTISERLRHAVRAHWRTAPRTALRLWLQALTWRYNSRWARRCVARLFDSVRRRGA